MPELEKVYRNLPENSNLITVCMDAEEEEEEAKRLVKETGITFQGGYDIKENKLTTSSVSISRDLHCWQMSFSWIPFGYHKSWSFNIGVKAASLSDLKYDKSQSMYDNMY